LGSIIEVVHGHGHGNIKASHRSTLEITKDDHLSTRGDCIVAVGADKGLADLSLEFKQCLRKHNSKLTITVEAGGESNTVVARGCENLTLLHPVEMVIRKTKFISERTLAVCSDKAACDLSRELVKRLTNPEQTVKITLKVGT